MFALAGSTPAEAKAAAKTVFDFEKRLAMASLDNVALRDPKQQDHPTSFAALQAAAPALNWGRYFDAAGMARGEVNVPQPAFLAQVNRELASTPLDAWRTYLRWHTLNAAADALPSPFVAEHFDFFGRYLSGAKEMKPRWKRCATDVDTLLGEALGRAYVEKYFPPEAKARMDDMVKNILLAMHDTIEGLDWMAPATKARALEKLVDLPAEDRLSRQVEGLRRRRSAPRCLPRQHAVARRAGTWRTTAGRSASRSIAIAGSMTPPTSNAYYNPSLNEIVFPAGILQPPAFDVNATDAVNYGAIGVVIGHEISHGFDDQGSQFDSQGPARQLVDAAGPHQVPGERGQCVVDQFEGYFIEPGIHHNGKLVLGESIGDLAGAKIALPRVPEVARGQGPRADPRRFHAGAAVLHRLGPVAWRRDASGDATHDDPGRPAPDREVPRQRAAVEPARVPHGVRLQGRRRRWCGRRRIAARCGDRLVVARVGPLACVLSGASRARRRVPASR